MKAVFATILLSILSAVVAVFSITELCSNAKSTASATDVYRSGRRDGAALLPRQKIQQWVNH